MTGGLRRLFIGLACLWAIGAAAAAAAERVEIASGEWRLVGEFQPARGAAPAPAVLLLHQAGGDRSETGALARELAARGVASLRLDLRGHGESVNVARFEPPYADNLWINENAQADIRVALDWLRAREGVAGDRLALLGSSYSGEKIPQALREDPSAAQGVRAFVILSPGSFSEESARQAGASGLPWLFIRTTEEGAVSRRWVDLAFEHVRAHAPQAELRVIEGTGHAGAILARYPEINAEIADWLAARLSG